MDINTNSNILRDVIIQNHTAQNLNNLFLGYENEEKPLIKISNLPRGQQLKKSLLQSHILSDKNLVLFKREENEIKKIDSCTVPEDNSSQMIISISMEDENLSIKASL